MLGMCLCFARQHHAELLSLGTSTVTLGGLSAPALASEHGWLAQSPG